MLKLLLKMLLACAIIFINLNLAKAQDYFITMRGDSIACRITNPNASGKHRYQRGENAIEPIELSPYDTKRYYIASKKALYRSVFQSNDSRPVFMLVTASGGISTYYYNGTGEKANWVAGGNTAINGQPQVMMVNANPSYAGLYIAKGLADTAMLIKPSGVANGPNKEQQKAAFAQMLMDKKEIYDKFIADGGFSVGTVKKYVQLYNEATKGSK
jgi:hypothetical protein